MKKIFTTAIFVLLVQLCFSQHLATIELHKEGKKDKWKWVSINHHDKPVLFEIRKELTGCKGKTTTKVIYRTIYSTKDKPPMFFDDYGFKCAENNYYTKIYSIISSKLLD